MTCQISFSMLEHHHYILYFRGSLVFNRQSESFTKDDIFTGRGEKIGKITFSHLNKFSHSIFILSISLNDTID